MMELEQHLAHYHLSNFWTLILLMLLATAVTFFTDWLDKRE